MKKYITAIVLIFALIVSCKRKVLESKESSINVSQPLNAAKDEEFAKFERDIEKIDKELKNLYAVYDEQNIKVEMLKKEIGEIISDGVDVKVPDKLNVMFEEHEAISKKISELEDQRLRRIREEERRRANKNKWAQQAAPRNH